MLMEDLSHRGSGTQNLSSKVEAIVLISTDSRSVVRCLSFKPEKKCHDLQIKVCHFRVENKKTDVIILHLAKLWSLR